MGCLPEVVLQALQERPFQLLELAEKLPTDGFTWRPYPGVKSIQEVLVHMLEAEEFWVHGVLQGGKPAARRASDYRTPAGLEAVWRPVRRQTLAFLRALPDDALRDTRPVDWQEEPLSVEYILWHSVTHEFHHKGQVCTRLAMLGVDVPDLDL